MTDNQIKTNLESILVQIKEQEIKSGRQQGSVKLCAVSKFHPQEAIITAINAGQLLFGENRVQEAYSKFSNINQLNIQKPDLHIIGSLQLNKVKKAVEISSCIESVDRKELLDEIEKQCNKLHKKIQILFEVHTGEESKSGFKDIDSLYKSIDLCMSGFYPHITPCGFMTMAPFTDNTQIIHNSFSTLRNIRDVCKTKFSNELIELSMGMSNDFNIAIEEGSTIVRIGTAIFGERETPVKSL